MMPDTMILRGRICNSSLQMSAWKVLFENDEQMSAWKVLSENDEKTQWCVVSGTNLEVNLG